MIIPTSERVFDFLTHQPGVTARFIALRLDAIEMDIIIVLNGLLDEKRVVCELNRWFARGH